MSTNSARVVAITIASLGLAAGFGCCPAAADEFRVENRVYNGDAKQPACRSTTIFYGDVVYDYLEQPAEIIVFEKSPGRFVTLDLARQVRAELTTDEVAAFTARLRQWAIGHRDPVISFLAAPKFQEDFKPARGQLTLDSPWLTYDARLRAAASPAVVEQYREFSDWYARLNTVLNPGSRPPFGRLALNEAIARHQAIAEEVVLTIAQKKGATTGRLTVRSQHDLTVQLTTTDIDRVAKTRDQMRNFKAISFEQYRKDMGR
jgi:hypothetical protein